MTHSQKKFHSPSEFLAWRSGEGLLYKGTLERLGEVAVFSNIQTSTNTKEAMEEKKGQNICKNIQTIVYKMALVSPFLSETQV